MPIDPRTLREVQSAADCHLIPDCFRVSHVTVRLDADFDSKIGATCDVELQRYFDAMFGSKIAGKAARPEGPRN